MNVRSCNFFVLTLILAISATQCRQPVDEPSEYEKPGSGKGKENLQSPDLRSQTPTGPNDNLSRPPGGLNPNSQSTPGTTEEPKEKDPLSTPPPNQPTQITENPETENQPIKFTLTIKFSFPGSQSPSRVEITRFPCDNLGERTESWSEVDSQLTIKTSLKSSDANLICQGTLGAKGPAQLLYEGQISLAMSIEEGRTYDHPTIIVMETSSKSLFSVKGRSLGHCPNEQLFDTEARQCINP